MGAVEVSRFLTALGWTGWSPHRRRTSDWPPSCFCTRTCSTETLAGWPGWRMHNGRSGLPVVLTRQEVQASLATLDGVSWIMGTLFYGAELRARECLRLCVKDVDFGHDEVLVREGKGDKDCATRLPSAVVPRLSAHLERVCTLHFCWVCRSDWDVEL